MAKTFQRNIQYKRISKETFQARQNFLFPKGNSNGYGEIADKNDAITNNPQ